MPNDPRQPADTSTADRPENAWRRVRQAYRRADEASFHALRWLCRLLLLAYFLFCALFLGLRYVVLPHIDVYRPDVERMAGRALGLQVTIGGIGASWQGALPRLSLSDVVIHDQAGGAALTLPSVAATVSWWSLAVGELRLRQLQIVRPDLEVRRDAQGVFLVAGLRIDPKQQGSGGAADWVLKQHEIDIVDGRLHWKDDLRHAPELLLQDVNVVLRNGGHRHRFALQAVPPPTLAAPLDVRASFVHPHFSQHIADPSQWSGVLYADLRDADLAAWKTYLDFPFDLQQAKGSMRAWLTFNHARVVDFTADLGMTDVVARLRADLQPLQLAAVSGRVSVQDAPDGSVPDGKLSFGARGHAVSLVDFSLRTSDGLVLPKTTVNERYLAAHDGRPSQTEVQVQQLDLQSLAAFVGRLPLTPEHLRMLTDFAPRGQLQDFSAQWQGDYPDLQSYRVAGRFSGLSMHAQPARPGRPAAHGVPARAAMPAIPGFANLSGRIDADDHGGSLSLDSRQLTLSLPAVFEKPDLQFDALKMDTQWTQKGDALQVNVHDLSFAGNGMTGTLSGTQAVSLDQPAGQNLGMADIRGTLDGAALDKVGDYLPLVMNADVRNWLTHALAGGTLHDGELRIKGDLAQFPFRAPKAGQRPPGQFVFSGRIEDGALNYMPGAFGRDGRMPMWPLLEKVDGTIRFDRTRMEIDGDAATHGAQLSKVKAVIPDLLADDALLQIDGHAAGSLQDMVRYTVNSPVSGWIGGFTDDVRANGDAALALKLTLPLNHVKDAKVLGTLKFDGNGITLLDGMPAITQTTGQLAFDENGVRLQAIKGNFLGGPLTISGGSQKDGAIVVKADGTLSAAGLRKAYPDAQQLTARLNGSTRFGTVVAIRNGRLDIGVESTLRGLGLDFPAPLAKAANDALPLKFELADAASGNAAVLRDTINVALGSAISAAYVREKSANDANASWRVVRGGIGVNAPAPEPDSGVAANVDLDKLDLDSWLALTPGAAGNGAGSGTAQKGDVKGDAKGGASASAPSGGASDDTQYLAQYVSPDAVAMRAGTLQVMGRKLEHVVLGASQDEGAWRANIDSAQASGYLSWLQSSSGRGLGKVTARLATLIVPRSASSDVKDLLEAKDPTTEMPALDIVAEQFQLYEKKLGRLDLTANYVRATSGREWRIRNLSLANPDATLSASGSWVTNGDNSSTNLSYRLTIADAGKLLDRFGYPGVLKGGKGRMNGDLSWNGSPFAFDIPSLSGTVSLDVASGQFLKVEPGAAKLLGVLSLQALPRRLTLDFRDVFSQGFAFDNVTGDANIEHGVATTDNFKMRGVNAAVLMDGQADIDKETQDLRVVVIPNINAGAASVVYGLAVNPVIGVGTFLAQLFLRAPLAQAFTYEYAITGPWNDPNVVKINHRKAAASPAAADAPASVPAPAAATKPAVPAGKED